MMCHSVPLIISEMQLCLHRDTFLFLWQQTLYSAFQNLFSLNFSVGSDEMHTDPCWDQSSYRLTLFKKNCCADIF